MKCPFSQELKGNLYCGRGRVLRERKLDPSNVCFVLNDKAKKLQQRFVTYTNIQILKKMF